VGCLIRWTSSKQDFDDFSVLLCEDGSLQLLVSNNDVEERHYGKVQCEVEVGKEAVVENVLAIENVE